MTRWHRAIAALAAAVVALSACGTPSRGGGGGGPDSGSLGAQELGMDPSATGPAPEVPGARRGGTITVYSQSTPNTLDPTDNYFTDSNEIGKLLFRTPTQFTMRQGKPVLVPDLTDLGTPSADKLTWTFKMRTHPKYADGTDVKIEDIAYAIKRSFAHDVFANGPTYQMTYFKDGDKYKGPYTGGDAYAGVETPDADTLVIHLVKPFNDLPFYMSFPLFTPIPRDKDTKVDYKNKPLATGPYQFDTFTPGTELTLKRNPNWDAASDPARHAYPDAWVFKWGQSDVKTQQQVINSSGEDANALNYGNLDASLIPQLVGDKQPRLVLGGSSCTIVWTIDSRKVSLDIRKAIAKAYPYDQIWTASGNNRYIGEVASTILPPSVPGHVKYAPLPDLSGRGKGDPAAAKQMLQAAGKLGFEVSWYFDNVNSIPQQVSQVRAEALRAAGFTVKPIGVTPAELRGKRADYDAPVNMGQSPLGWCSDWPSGGSWFPVLFQTHSIDDGSSWGMLSDPALDARIDEVNALPVDQAATKWGDLDKEIMGMYIALPGYYGKTALVAGANIGGSEVDVTVGMPLFQNLFVKG